MAIGLNGDTPTTPEQMNQRELAIATYKLAYARYSSDVELYGQMGALVRELSNVTGALTINTAALQQAARSGKGMSLSPPNSHSSTPSMSGMPSPSTPAARERLQSLVDLEQMSKKAATLVDLGTNADDDDTEVRQQKLVFATNAAQDLHSMLEERRHKAFAKMESNEAWAFRLKVLGGLAAAIPVSGALLYVAIWIFRLLMVAAK